jgi:hypothetical protein
MHEDEYEQVQKVLHTNFLVNLSTFGWFSSECPSVTRMVPVPPILAALIAWYE